MSNWALPTAYGPEVQVGISTSTTTPTTITPGGTSTKGSWVELSSSAPLEIYALSICHMGNVSNREVVFDVGIGSGGSEQVVALDLPFSVTYSTDFSQSFPVPVRIPKGERIAIRAGGNSSTDRDVCLKLFGAPEMGHAGLASSAETYGVAAAYNGFSATVDPGVTANTKGAWVEVTPSTSKDHRGVMLHCSRTDSNTTDVLHLMDVAAGAAGSEQILFSDIVVHRSGRNVYIRQGYMAAGVPSGTRLAVRSQSPNTTTGQREIGCAIIGFS